MYMVENLKDGSITLTKDESKLRDVILKLTDSEDVTSRVSLTTCLLFKCEGMSVQYKDMRLSWHPNKCIIDE
jgi:hypothetical protein